jgi:16S rRNA (adenine1518-N6/adenine1519-N6)-dimethyltransferase
MDLTNIDTIKNLCRDLDIRPSKKLGQNFLINKNVLNKIVEAGDLSKKDNVLEIGPGFGVLTRPLLENIGHLMVVEKDKRLYSRLKTVFKGNIEVINNDILDIEVDFKEYKVISNLPYQITSLVLWRFLNEVDNKPEMMVLMVQKEVAERILAQPGQMSVLAVMCQFYADIELVEWVNRSNFYPEPDVDSAVIKLKIKKEKINVNEKEFFRIVKIGFSTKRKMLKNNLSNGLHVSGGEIENILKDIGLNIKIRAQNLGVEDWKKLVAKLT